LGAVGATRAQGDADGNGLVDGLDLDLWRSYAEQGAGQGATQGAPEPAAGSLVAAGLAFGAARFRRGRREAASQVSAGRS
jgi:hypothetical protein